MYYVILSVLFSLAFPATLHVPLEYESIQEALNNINEGDTVLVAIDTYYISETSPSNMMMGGGGYIQWPDVDNVYLIGDTDQTIGNISKPTVRFLHGK